MTKSSLPVYLSEALSETLSEEDFPLGDSRSCCLSGPVLRDTARLSQRYPRIARYGVFGVSTWPIGCDTPSPFSERFPPWRACKVGVRYPPLKRGISAILARYPMKTRQNACDTPLCDTISKGYCAIWGGISHWAAKHVAPNRVAP